jgi:hypothetical protein
MHYMYIYAVPGLHPTFDVLAGYSGTGVNFFIDTIRKVCPELGISFEVDSIHAHFN